MVRERANFLIKRLVKGKNKKQNTCLTVWFRYEYFFYKNLIVKRLCLHRMT